MPQAKPPAYVVAEIEVTNLTPYDKEYVPAAQMEGDCRGGGKYIVRGGENAALYGEPPKRRIAMWSFENMDKAKAAFDLRPIGGGQKGGGPYVNFASTPLKVSRNRARLTRRS